MKKYIGSFSYQNTCYLIAIKAFGESHLMKKVDKIQERGWEYDGVYSPLREVESIPEYIKIIF